MGAPQPSRPKSSQDFLSAAKAGRAMAKRAAVEDQEELDEESQPKKKPKVQQANGSRILQDDEEIDELDEDFDLGEINKDEETVIRSKPEKDQAAADRAYERAHEERMREEVFGAKNDGEGRIADHGVIVMVELVNFMCHDLLTVKFGPQVNFVIGHNGSGKSAILTGVTVGLGGKASATGRGSGLKQFIQDGKEAAEITVVIKNEGPEAFKHDVYGDTISVIRKITRSGSSAYKICAAPTKTARIGKIISTKKEELSALCDHMNIQVDNPMNILTQDNARAFLSKSDAKEKYRFFLKGTQLHQLTEEYEDIRTQLHSIQQSRSQKELVLPELRDVYRNAREVKRQAAAAVGHQEKVARLETEAAWAYIIAKEQEVERAQKELDSQQRRVTKVKESIESFERDKFSAEERVAEAEAEVGARTDSLEPTRAQRKEVQDQIKVEKTAMLGCRADQSEINVEMDSCTSTMKDLQAAIDREEAKGSAANKDKNIQLKKQIDDFTLKLQRIDLEIPNRQKMSDDAQAKVNAIKDEIPPLQSQQSQAQDRVLNFQNQLRQLESQRGGNRLNGFGTNLGALLSAIKNERWEGITPIGPLGMYVNLKDMKWKHVLETVLGQILQGFAVTTQRDLERLRELMKRCMHNNAVKFLGRNNQLPTIYFFTPDPHKDFSGGDLTGKILGRSGQPLPTIVSVLEISNSDVIGLLVDRSNVERTLLTERREDANEAAKSARGSSVFTLDLFRISANQRGNLSSVPMEQARNNFFAKDIEADLRVLQAQLSSAHDDYSQFGEQIKAVNIRLQQAHGEVRSHQETIMRLERSKPAFQKKINDLHDQLVDEEPPNVVALYEALQEQQLKKDELRIAFEAAETRLNAVKDRISPLHELYTQLTDEIANYTANGAAIEEELQRQVKRVVEAKSKLSNQRDMKLPLEMKKAADLQAAFDGHRMQLEEWTAGVMEHYPQRVETGRTPDVIKKELDREKRLLERSEARVGITAELATEKVLIAKNTFIKAKADCETLVKLLVALKSALAVRMDAWHSFRRHIALRARVNFGYHLDQRQFTGKLDFDHTKGLLELKVYPNEESANASSKKEKDTSNLSGGEKSFSTICLLLSLWEAVGCPIRCLDEFDVYMDAVNRRISMKMLMDTAKRSNGVQYVLITPQNINSMQWGPAVRVVRLADPERGVNGRLNLSVEQEEGAMSP